MLVHVPSLGLRRAVRTPAGSAARRGSSRRLGAIAVALAGSAALAGCANPTGGAGDTGFVPAEATGITTIAAANRVAAPVLAGMTLKGDKLALSDYHGHFVVVNVWGSWCTPCRGEAPGLEETYQKYQSDGVKFIGINTRDNNAAALAFTGSHDITYPSLQDPNEALVLRFKSILPPTTIPSTAIIDDNGKVCARILGEVTESQLAATLDTVMKEG
jgi:thiol-disulfide isomerase/thioredoxin